jgi:hypothetical protein
MMKRILRLVVPVVCTLALLPLGACGSSPSQTAQDLGNAVASFLAGDVTGEVGKEYNTQWFSFTIKSIEHVDSYAGYTAEPGNELLVAVIAEKNTFSRSIPIGTYDWFVDSDTFSDYVYPLDPLDDTMMPDEMNLAVGQSVEYRCVYEVPVGLTDLRFMYVEVDESEQTHATFTIPVK